MHATEPQGRFCPDPRYSPNQPTGWVVTDAGHDMLTDTTTADGPSAPAQLQDQSWHDSCDSCGGVFAIVPSTEPTCGTCAQGEAAAIELSCPAGSVLRSAALYLERHGWIQGAYYDTSAVIFTPAADIAGAIGMACYGGPVEAPAQHFNDPGFLDFEEALLHLDRWLLVHDGSECYEFNDAKGRQLPDVLRVLREAADTPAAELIDALRVLHVTSEDMACRLRLLVPGGAFAEDAHCERGLCPECTAPDGCIYGDPSESDGDA